MARTLINNWCVNLFCERGRFYFLTIFTWKRANVNCVCCQYCLWRQILLSFALGELQRFKRKCYYHLLVFNYRDWKKIVIVRSKRKKFNKYILSFAHLRNFKNNSMIHFYMIALVIVRPYIWQISFSVRVTKNKKHHRQGNKKCRRQKKKRKNTIVKKKKKRTAVKKRKTHRHQDEK